MTKLMTPHKYTTMPYRNPRSIGYRRRNHERFVVTTVKPQQLPTLMVVSPKAALSPQDALAKLERIGRQFQRRQARTWRTEAAQLLDDYRSGRMFPHPL